MRKKKRGEKDILVADWLADRTPRGGRRISNIMLHVLPKFTSITTKRTEFERNEAKGTEKNTLPGKSPE